MLVIAPAGSGKTQLLSAWAAAASTPITWLSLDESDRDAVQLWTGIIAALEQKAPGSGARALEVLRTAGDPIAAVTALLDDFEDRCDTDIVLVVDDLHLVDGAPGVAESMSVFLQHLPPSVRVVLASRRLPRLPLDRLRARGQLVEVGFKELRFSDDESRALLEVLVPWLDDIAAERFIRHADGWAADLQLAALAARAAHARGDALESFDPGEVLVAQYLSSEVLAAEPVELVDVLRDIAVVDRVNASLGIALTGRTDVAECLRDAEAAGLFLKRIGNEGWYELHSVLRALLVRELAERDPDRLSALRVRAARWLEDAGEVVLALRFWLAAERPGEALRLLAVANRELFESRRDSTIVETLAQIPPAVAYADLGSMVDYAWCHFAVDLPRFVELVEHAAWRATTSLGAGDSARLGLTMLQAIAATARGDWDRGGALARAALDDAGEQWVHDRLARFGWNLVARELAYGERWDELAVDVRTAVHEVARDPERRVMFDGTRAVGAALAGRPIDALRIAAGVRGAADVSNLVLLGAELAMAEALAAREIGDRVQALGALEQIAAGALSHNAIGRVVAAAELVFARLAEGDVDAAVEQLQRAREIVVSEKLVGGAHSLVARAAVGVALAAGLPDDARRELLGVDDDFWSPVCDARIQLAVGAAERARAALDAARPRCQRHEVIRDLLRARAASDDTLAVKHVCAAIDLASSTGMLQTVASECHDIMEIVEREALRAPELWMQRLRALVADGTERVPAEVARFAEQLTERERDVLRFLPSRLTIKEIADELYLSVNTLKFHLKVIYRKLGVRSRAEAADVARRMMTTRRS